MSAKEKTTGFLAEFRKFIARGNVMDLASASSSAARSRESPTPW